MDIDLENVDNYRFNNLCLNIEKERLYLRKKQVLLFFNNLLNNKNNFLDNNRELGITGGILDFSETNPFGEPTVILGNSADMIQYSVDSTPISVDEI